MNISKKYFLFDVDGVVASSIDFFTGLWKEISEE